MTPFRLNLLATLRGEFLFMALGRRVLVWRIGPCPDDRVATCRVEAEAEAAAVSYPRVPWASDEALRGETRSSRLNDVPHTFLEAPEASAAEARDRADEAVINAIRVGTIGTDDVLVRPVRHGERVAAGDSG